MYLLSVYVHIQLINPAILPSNFNVMSAAAACLHVLPYTVFYGVQLHKACHNPYAVYGGEDNQIQ